MSRNDRRAETLEAPELGASQAPIGRRVKRPGGLRTDLSLPGQVWHLARWPLLEQILGFAVWFVDIALAGRLAQEAAAATNAVGVASYVTWLMGLLQGAVGIAAMAVIARSVGARHRRRANAALGQSMLIALTWGAAIGVVIFIVAPFFATVSNLDGRSYELCVMYLRMLAVVAPCMAVLFIGGACLRGAGDFRSPFGVMVVVNLVNVGTSVLFVMGPAPVGGHGLAGIAAGTMVAWAMGALLMLARLYGGKGGIRLHLHRVVRPHPTMMGRIVRVAWPALMDQAGLWLGNFVILMVVGQLAGVANAQGAHVIAIRIEGFSFLPGFAFSQAAATMVGQYLGAEDRRMARRSAWVCWGYGATFMTTLGVIFLLFPEQLVWLVTDEPTLLDQAPRLVWLAGWGQIGFATSIVFAGVLRGAGDTRTTMMINYGSTYLVRLPMVWLFAMSLGWGLTGVWIALVAELLLRGLFFLGRFLHGGWARVEV